MPECILVCLSMPKCLYLDVFKYAWVYLHLDVFKYAWVYLGVFV